VHRTRHDFRRSASRNLIAAGVSEVIAMTVTGHKTRSTFDRYNIVSPAEKLEAARKLAAFSEDAARRATGAPNVVTPLFARERAK
jgi:integrase